MDPTGIYYNEAALFTCGIAAVGIDRYQVVPGTRKFSTSCNILIFKYIIIIIRHVLYHVCTTVYSRYYRYIMCVNMCVAIRDYNIIVIISTIRFCAGIPRCARTPLFTAYARALIRYQLIVLIRFATESYAPPTSTTTIYRSTAHGGRNTKYL